MISISDFSFKYDGAEKNVLNNINMTIEDGDFLGIIGHSGAGKSTLTYAINAIIPHYYKGDFYGAINIDGLDTVDTNLTDISKLVGSVCQDIDSQMVSAVVEDEMLYGLENFNIPKEEIEERISSALNEIGISHLRKRNINSLSGGQKQKVAIASIIALKPKILLLDEPTGELDPQSSRQVFLLLKEMSEKHKITVIVVEQKIMLLCEFAKHLAVIDHGRLIVHDKVEKVLESSEILEQSGINCPRTVTLSNTLRKRGIENIPVCKTVDEAEKMVKSLIQKEEALND